MNRQKTASSNHQISERTLAKLGSKHPSMFKHLTNVGLKTCCWLASCSILIACWGGVNIDEVMVKLSCLGGNAWCQLWIWSWRSKHPSMFKHLTNVGLKTCCWLASCSILIACWGGVNIDEVMVKLSCLGGNAWCQLWIWSWRVQGFFSFSSPCCFRVL